MSPEMAMTYLAILALAVVAALLFQARGVIAVILCNPKMQVGDYDGALRIARWVSLGFPNPLLLHREALTLSLAGRLSEAEQRYRKALAMTAGTKYRVERLHACLGYVLMDRGRYDEAEQSFQRAIKAGDVTGSSQAGLAELRLAQGVEAEKALEYAGQAMERAKRRPGKPVAGPFWSDQAWALALLGRGEEAREALAQAMRVPEASVFGRAEMHWRAGMALEALQQTEEARGHFQMGHDLDPRGKYGRRCVEHLA
jgi:tetratricopeptide (TPR) repeat protein